MVPLRSKQSSASKLILSLSSLQLTLESTAGQYYEIIPAHTWFIEIDFVPTTYQGLSIMNKILQAFLNSPICTI
jgi:hypothetical protein